MHALYVAILSFIYTSTHIHTSYFTFYIFIDVIDCASKYLLFYWIYMHKNVHIKNAVFYLLSYVHLQYALHLNISTHKTEKFNCAFL